MHGFNEWKKYIVRKFLVGFMLLGSSIGSINAFGDEPICYPYNNNPYCRYEGLVDRLYVNASNQILMYFDIPISDLSEAQGYFGDGVIHAGAATARITDNPDFVKSLYATLLAAKVTGATVTVQMRGEQVGYLRMDRVWLN